MIRQAGQHPAGKSENRVQMFVHCMSLGKVLKLCKSIQLIIRASQAVTKIGNTYETPSFKPGTQ